MSRLLSTLHFLLLLPLRISSAVLARLAPWLPLTWAHRLHLLAGTGTGGHPTDAASVADRWVRRLEEETGAVCESRVGDFAGTSTSTAVAGAGPGPSTLSRRRSELSKAAGQRLLPDFFMGSYEGALRVAEKELRPMCVVLVSEEHDDVAEFKRLTLVDEELNRILRENDFVVWGGDVRDYEAYQAFQKLGATTYPFVAFIALQPRGGRNSTSSTLTVLSRHQGPAVPRSPLASPPTSTSASSAIPTAASTLTHHLAHTLLPRVSPHLTRLRTSAAERALAAQLIAEQNAAFAASAERDRERIEMAEIARSEREEEERRRQREEEERGRREEEARVKGEELRRERALWWRFARRSLLAPEPGADSAEGGGKAVRIALRLPSGARVVRTFMPSTPATQLYLAAASQLIPQEDATSDDPVDPPPSFSHVRDAVAIEEKCWNFVVATAYPRFVIPSTGKMQIGEIKGLLSGGVVVVEMQDEGESRNADVDSDGYASEED